MKSITQEARWKHQVLSRIQKIRGKGDKHAVSRTAKHYHIPCVKTIYDWQKQWDGTWKSLLPHSHRPHSSPRAHTEAEVQLIIQVYRECGFIESLLLWQELLARGYTRSYGGMKRFIRKRFGTPAPPKKPDKKPQPYQGGAFPGDKLQLDVKYVPGECVKYAEKLYQFTAVDECTRWAYREIYHENSTYSAKCFLEHLVGNAPFPIRLIQTDNGTEWTNALLAVKSTQKTLFEQALLDMGIEYKRIRIATPRHNGRVERQHGLDGKRFYRREKFYSLEEARLKIARYNDWRNSRIKTCLGFHSPDAVVADYLALM